jgi:hypothetical protein
MKIANTKSLLLLLLFLATTLVNAQLVLNLNSLPNEGTRPIGLCKSDTFRVVVKNINTGTNNYTSVKFHSKLPVGFHYVAGSAFGFYSPSNTPITVTDGFVQSGTNELFELLIQDIPTGAGDFEVKFVIESDCNVTQQNIFDTLYYNQNGTPATNSYTITQFVPKTPTLVILSAGGTPSILSNSQAKVGDTWKRFYHIRNSGITSSCVDNIIITDVGPTALGTLGFEDMAGNPRGTIFYNGFTADGLKDSVAVQFNAVDLLAMTGKAELCAQDSIKFRQKVSLDSCVVPGTSGVSNITLSTACDGVASCWNYAYSLQSTYTVVLSVAKIYHGAVANLYQFDGWEAASGATFNNLWDNQRFWPDSANNNNQLFVDFPMLDDDWVNGYGSHYGHSWSNRGPVCKDDELIQDRVYFVWNSDTVAARNVTVYSFDNPRNHIDTNSIMVKIGKNGTWTNWRTAGFGLALNEPGFSANGLSLSDQFISNNNLRQCHPSLPTSGNSIYGIVLGGKSNNFTLNPGDTLF